MDVRSGVVRSVLVWNAPHRRKTLKVEESA
jgi:hypothetical protein